MPSQWLGSFIRLPLLVRLLILVSLLILFFGSVAHIIEPQTFPTIFDGIWWAIITASTVGYGDFAPKTILGRICAILLILIGASFLATYFGKLASTVIVKQGDLLKGLVNYKGSNHIVIIGWNERTKTLIQSIHSLNKKEQIMIIDETLEENPYNSNYIHFVKGRSCLDAILLRANIKEAQTIVITADQSKTETQSDMFTILTLLAIKGLQPSAYVVAEILTESQLENAKRAGANDIIQSNLLSSYYMIHSIASRKNNTSYIDLLKAFSISNIHFIHLNEELLRMNYVEVCSKFLQENKLIIGIYRDAEVIINPPNETNFIPTDQLILIQNTPINIS